MSQLPIIDLARPSRDLAPAIATACRDHGLFYLTGHGLDPALIENLAEQSRAFFALDAAEKARVAQPAPDQIRGYIGLGKAALAATRGEIRTLDLKESFNMGPITPRAIPGGLDPAMVEAHLAPNLWPSHPPDFRRTWEAAYHRFETLADRVFGHLEMALQVEAGFFQKMIDRHVSVLGAIRYPDLPPDAAPQGQRAGAHRDFGGFSLLHLEDGRDGLQAQAHDGRWVPVPPRAGTLVLLLGDMMTRWTAGAWRAPLHRVVEDRPPGMTGASGPNRNGRLTLGYFQHPNLDALVTPLPTFRAGPVETPLLAGEHLYRQFNRQQDALS